MELSSLMIQPQRTWDPGYKPGAYVGKIEYANNGGKVELALTPELSAKILAVVAEDLVAASKEVAQRLTASIITQAALPAASGEGSAAGASLD